MPFTNKTISIATLGVTALGVIAAYLQFFVVEEPVRTPIQITNLGDCNATGMTSGALALDCSTTVVENTPTIQDFWNVANSNAPGAAGRKEAIEALVEANQTFIGYDVSCERLGQETVLNIGPLTGGCKGAAHLEKLVVSGNFRNSNFSGAILRNSDFSYGDLYGADFSFSELYGAKFENAGLNFSNFSFARLSDASFSNARLTNAFFNHADLSGANFINALLDIASLEAALISGANFTGAHGYRGEDEHNGNKPFIWHSAPSFYSDFNDLPIDFDITLYDVCLWDENTEYTYAHIKPEPCLTP